jgi:hypothetical protein
MKSFRPYFYSTLQLIVFLLSFILDDTYGVLSIALTSIVLLSLLDKLGKGIVLRELIAFHGCFTCLIMPLVGYKWYTIDNALSRLWVSYMKVPADYYFSFTLPAMALFAVVISWPASKLNVSDTGAYLNWYINRAKPVLERNSKPGYQILIVGVACSLVVNSLPSSLLYVGWLMYFGAFAGFLFVYYTPNLPKKKLILWAFAIYIFGAALATGMFTIVAYMGMTIFSFLFLGRKTSMLKKVSLFVVAVFALLLIQSVKKDYRNVLWAGYEGNKVELFSNLVADRVTSGVSFFTVDAFFRIYSRGNQGFNVALVMKRFPAEKDFDNGSNIWTALLSSFVPRALWPDKPFAGGQFNMEYYTGWKIKGWSTNVGPLGEAYGSFGPTGGIFYMGVLALFIRFAYLRFIWVSRKFPLLLFWLPALFLQVTYSMETDTLQITNTLVKGAFFLWLIYKFKPDWFGIKKVNKIRLQRGMSERTATDL